MHLGGTVGELKHRMSYAEFIRWCKFFEKSGRCGPVRMFDRGFALLAWKIDHALGGNSEMTNYLPFYKEPDLDVPVEQAIKMFGGELKRG